MCDYDVVLRSSSVRSRYPLYGVKGRLPLAVTPEMARLGWDSFSLQGSSSGHAGLLGAS